MARVEFVTYSLVEVPDSGRRFVVTDGLAAAKTFLSRLRRGVAATVVFDGEGNFLGSDVSGGKPSQYMQDWIKELTEDEEHLAADPKAS